MKHFLADRQGNIAIVAALGFPVFAGGLALGTEAGYWLVQKSQLAMMTDALAVSAVKMRDKDVAIDKIKQVLKANMVTDGYPSASTVNVEYPDNRTITVTTSTPATKYFSTAFYKGSVDIAAKTTIEVAGDPVCILALNPTKPAAFKMTGNASAALDDCVTASNSSSSSSSSLGGSSSLGAYCMYAVGTISGPSRAQTVCPDQYVNQKPIKDPLASLTRPTELSCGVMQNFAPNTTYTIEPGCYDSGTDVKGTVTFKPGVYILKDTTLNINSGAIINGAGVTFVLKGSSRLNFNGGATITLSAPTKSSLLPTAGILFLGSATGARDHFIAGNAGSSIEGITYLPKDNITFTGNSGLNTSCLRLIADTVELTGNSGFRSDCNGKLGGYNPSTSTGLKIVL